MGMLHNLGMGFGIALVPLNLFFIVMGQLVGVSVGILPGINASMAVGAPPEKISNAPSFTCGTLPSTGACTK